MSNSLPSKIWVLDNDEVEPEIFDEEREGTACYVRESELAAVRENVPEGYKLVPIEPTAEMIHAMRYLSEKALIGINEIPVAGETAFPFVGADLARRMYLQALSEVKQSEIQNNHKYPERDKSKAAEQQGFFNKFRVYRVDGSDAEGSRHHGCRNFVLDLDHDAHAADAMRAYAQSCAMTHPVLSAAIKDMLNAVPDSEGGR